MGAAPSASRCGPHRSRHRNSGIVAAAAIPEDLKAWVAIYDGGFPMPFAEGSFASVLATEVIEHIEDYQGAIVDIARVTARQALGRDTG